MQPPQKRRNVLNVALAEWQVAKTENWAEAAIPL